MNRESRGAAELHEKVVAAVGNTEQLFVMKPSLEAEFGIGRNASDKPARVVAAIADEPVTALPETLVNAVRAIMSDGDEQDAPADDSVVAADDPTPC